MNRSAKPRVVSAALMALIAIVTVPTPADAEVPPDVKRAAGSKVADPSKPVPVAEPAAATVSLPSAPAGGDSEDAAKLQAARLRYSQLSNQAPGQLADFESRAKEIDRQLRASLDRVPVPPTTRPTIPTTVPSAPVARLPATRPAAAAAPVMPTAVNKPPAVKLSPDQASAIQARGVAMDVAGLRDLAGRLEAEGAVVRRLSLWSDDGVWVRLHPETAARLNAIANVVAGGDDRASNTARR